MEKLEKHRLEPMTESPTTTSRTTEIIQLPPKVSSNHPVFEELNTPAPELSGLRQYRGPCNCSKIIMTSNNPTTISKHGAELGQYTLVGGLHGRPVYRHIHRSFFLFYQPESGGNWLVNTKPGLMYGGIQNSKVTKS